MDLPCSNLFCDEHPHCRFASTKAGLSDVLKQESDSRTDPFGDNGQELFAESDLNNNNAKDNEELQKHEKVRFTCNICGNQFTMQRNLKMHQKTVHGNGGKQCKCSECDYAAVQKVGVIKHVQSVHGGITLPCDSCNKVYKWQADLIRHKERVHAGIKFKCSICKKEFSEKRCLRIHNQSVHLHKKFECGICKLEVRSKGYLWIHMQAVHEGKQFSCDECDFKTARKSDLSRHTKFVHKSLKDLKCVECGYVTGRRDYLKTHISLVHGEVFCEGVTWVSLSLSDHKPTVHKGEGFLCDQCDLVAGCMEDFIKHRLVHEKERKYNCDDCTYATFTKEYLRIHRSSAHPRITQPQHEALDEKLQNTKQKKKVSCNKCDYQASTEVIMQKHNKSKHEGKLIQCEKCPFQASKKGELVSHNKSVHKQEKRYGCDFCSYATSIKGQLLEHLKCDHKGRKYECLTCGVTVTTKQSLERHQFLLKCFPVMVRDLKVESK